MKNYLYVGNCTNVFDEDTGECALSMFNDVSDFAYQDENSENIDAKEFYERVIIPENLKTSLSKNLEYKYYDQSDIYVIYDDDTDIHYFFSYNGK